MEGVEVEENGGDVDNVEDPLVEDLINEMEELIYTCSVKQSSLSDFYTSQ